MSSQPPKYEVAPPSVRKLSALGLEVAVERGAGEPSGFADADYEAEGAVLVDGDDAWAAELVVDRVERSALRPILHRNGPWPQKAEHSRPAATTDVAAGDCATPNTQRGMLGPGPVAQPPEPSGITSSSAPCRPIFTPPLPAWPRRKPRP